MDRYAIKHGETYTIVGNAALADGTPVVLDGSWTAACRVTRDKVGGPLVLDVPDMTIADGQATYEIDTGDAPWTAGTYYYDVRATNAEGKDFWGDPVKLTLTARNTPES